MTIPSSARTIAAITAVAAPGMIVAVITAASGCAALLVGRPLLLGPMPISLAEAAATNDAPEVVLRIGYGEDPHARTPVRLLQGPTVMLTALEASVLSGRPAILDMLRARDVVDDASVHRLRCLADTVDTPYRDSRMKAYLAALDKTHESCDGFTMPW